jgi:perosamine synthetase
VKAQTREIPLSGTYLGEREEELVLDVLRSGRLSLGPTLDRFEDLFAEAVGAPYAAAVSSGTAGLHLLCHAAGLGPGDEVITTPLSFAASANCFLYEGATPVFADVDAQTLNVDPVAVEAAITERTRAIVAVDIFGYPCELDPLRSLAERHRLALIQDACEALGAEYRGRVLGSHGPSAVFAFYPNKQITTGEGGMIVSPSPEVKQRIDSERNQGRSPDMGWLDHDRLGFNYRLDDMSCALGLAQLERLEELLAGRARVAGLYSEALADIEGLDLPCPDSDGNRRSWFVYVVQLPRGVDRDAAVTAMRERGVDTKPYLPAIHLMSFYRERFGHKEGDFPVCEDVAARSLALPFYPQLTDDEVEQVVEALRHVLGG